MLQPISALLQSQVLTRARVIAAGGRGCQVPANTSKKFSGELCGTGDYRQSQWSLSSSLSSSDPSPVKHFIGGEIFILKCEIIAHADFLPLILSSASNEKMDKIAKIPEWYPRLSLMSWMRDNRILTVNQQEPISSDLLVRGQPFPSKNLVNATRLGHSWLTPRLGEDI